MHPDNRIDVGPKTKPSVSFSEGLVGCQGHAGAVKATECCGHPFILMISHQILHVLQEMIRHFGGHVINCCHTIRGCVV